GGQAAPAARWSSVRSAGRMPGAASRRAPGTCQKGGVSLTGTRSAICRMRRVTVDGVACAGERREPALWRGSPATAPSTLTAEERNVAVRVKEPGRTVAPPSLAWVGLLVDHVLLEVLGDPHRGLHALPVGADHQLDERGLAALVRLLLPGVLLAGGVARDVWLRLGGLDPARRGLDLIEQLGGHGSGVIGAELGVLRVEQFGLG